MADYYSLLSQLLEGLPDSTPAVREGIYDRARRALSEQLKTVEPPLTAAEIEREGRSLEESIQRLEALQPEGGVRPVREHLPPAEGVRVSPPAAEEPEEAPDRGREAIARPETVAIRRGGRRQRPSAILLLLVLLAVPVAVLAFLWRDRPTPAAPSQDVAQGPTPAPSPANDAKYVERVGGGQAPRLAPAVSPTPRDTSPAPQVEGTKPAPASAPVPSASQDVAIAQRALFFEENQADPQTPIMTSGRAIWRLDAINSGQGQPLETVIRGGVDVPSAGLALTILIRRNLDPTLPASHTIELTFAMSATASGPARVVRDVALPMMRPEETIRGVAVAGLPVPVKENLFLVGLSDLKGDVERNSELLLRRNWVELPIRFANGQKAVLLFDKGVSGERVFLDAFRQWGQAP